jgi:nucleotidyltransferase substrate binding protein (TIGR01987 family)
MTQGPLEIQPLRDAISALADALDLVNDQAWFNHQPEKLRKTLVAGVIQSIEFVYELGIKTMKRIMEAQAASASEIDQLAFRDLLRTAAEMGLIDDVLAWFRYRDMRNITSHTYDQAKAQQVLLSATPFLCDARKLLERIEASNV